MTEHTETIEPVRVDYSQIVFHEEWDGMEFSTTAYYIPANTPQRMSYIHRDGKVRVSTLNQKHYENRHTTVGHRKFNSEKDIWEVYTGFFSTREEAEKVCAAYNAGDRS